MAEGSNFDYLFKVRWLGTVESTPHLTWHPQVVLIGDSGVGKSYVLP
jgi:hypothetical protein